MNTHETRGEGYLYPVCWSCFTKMFCKNYAVFWSRNNSDETVIRVRSIEARLNPSNPTPSSPRWRRSTYLLHPKTFPLLSSFRSSWHSGSADFVTSIAVYANTRTGVLAVTARVQINNNSPKLSNQWTETNNGYRLKLLSTYFMHDIGTVGSNGNIITTNVIRCHTLAR
jgi:hypothetical protein